MRLNSFIQKLKGMQIQINLKILKILILPNKKWDILKSKQRGINLNQINNKISLLIILLLLNRMVLVILHLLKIMSKILKKNNKKTK